MSAKFFLDTNVCIYAFDSDSRKKQKALELIISSQATVSTQVLMETSNVALKKLKLRHEEIQLSIDYITTFCSLHIIELSTVKLAFQISRQHQYSLYDALIIASAFESNCNILYSEDMQHGHCINKQLNILNPFL
jgi:predicted nucleic acid-binding protein